MEKVRVIERENLGSGTPLCFIPNLDMSELLPTSEEGTILYSDDKVYYLDMSTAGENYEDFYYYDTKDEYLNNTIDNEMINLPGHGWNDSTAVYISKN